MFLTTTTTTTTTAARTTSTTALQRLRRRGGGGGRLQMLLQGWLQQPRHGKDNNKITSASATAAVLRLSLPIKPQKRQAAGPFAGWP